MPRVRRDERGAVVPIVALALIALFGMVVLAVDVGGLMARRRGMVNAADSAALAAAMEFAVGNSDCASGDWGSAQFQADSLAATNDADPDVSRVLFDPNCEEQTIRVTYEVPQDLFFAPVLGFPDETPVRATAVAQWGESLGGNPLPIELDPMLTQACAYDDLGKFNPKDTLCPEGFWFNNQDLTNSGWGLMNLLSWGVAADANCNNAGGADQLSDWIMQTDPIGVKLSQVPTYVCTTDGGKAPNWFRDLGYWANEEDPKTVFLFPVNDPSQMIMGPPTSIQKYAIVNFAPMKIEAVYEGDDPAAIGTVGSSGSCARNNVDIAAYETIDLDVWGVNQGCFSTAPVTIRFANVRLAPRGGGPAYVKCVPSATPPAYCDYTYDEGEHLITWLRPSAADRTRVEFEWSNPGTSGACGSRPSDPNAWCLVLKWAGPELIGEDPDPEPGEDCMVCAIRLIE